MQSYTKMRSTRHHDVIMKVIPGHFVTPNSHINYYIDMTTMKTRQNEAMAAARAMSENYVVSTVVDTIVCMDGMEVIGAYMAEELTRAGIMSMNAHKTIYIMSPEYDLSGQMIVRENNQMMVRGKHVLLLLASATTGQTIARAQESINYYGGTIVGISAIYSAVSKVMDYSIHALYTAADLPDYRSYSPANCKMCQNNEPIDAICNGFGYSRL
ncbi:MAG: orotate phosphoribosyltransferase [Lachnospiraceae bacterium]|nr:orotate phosphoribosyltransferase [Lachnospiraceae bacterium]